MKPEIQTIPIASLASGDRLFLKLYTFVGQSPGKTAYLQANLHGAEIAGNAVIDELIRYFRRLPPEQLSGEVRLVPVCNPIAMNERSHHFSSGRFNPYDGKDWNRIFWDYEKYGQDDLIEFAQINLTQEIEIVQQHYRQSIMNAFVRAKASMATPSSAPFHEKYRSCLQSLSLDADYIIDLHSSTNDGLNYIYYFQDRANSAKQFLMPIGIELDVFDGDAFDEAFIRPWLKLEEQFASLGRHAQFDIEAFTLELGSGMQMNPDSIKQGVAGIQNYLRHKQMLHIPDSSADCPQPSAIYLTTNSRVERYYAPSGGLLTSRASLGQKVEEGDPLYHLLCFSKEDDYPITTTVQAKQSGLVFDLSLNNSLNEGDYVLSIL
ncbi:MAG: succinylglutamate desuccinylase/aspartoacylase family protein [Cyanobacteria bacterium J06626_14]